MTCSIRMVHLSPRGTRIWSDNPSPHFREVMLTELEEDAVSLNIQHNEHDHGPSPLSSPLKVTATSPLRIDIAELRCTADSKLEGSLRPGSRSEASAHSSGSGASYAHYQAEIHKLEAELEKAKREAVSAYGLIEQLVSSDEILAKYEASRSKERQLLKNIKASTPMKKSQLFKNGVKSNADRSLPHNKSGAPIHDGPSLHAVHHAGKARFGKSRGLKLLPRDLRRKVAAKSEREERKRRSSSDWDKIDEDGDSKICPDGGSPESDSNDMGASGAFVNDDKVISKERPSLDVFEMTYIRHG